MWQNLPLTLTQSLWTIMCKNKQTTKTSNCSLLLSGDCNLRLIPYREPQQKLAVHNKHAEVRVCTCACVCTHARTHTHTNPGFSIPVYLLHSLEAQVRLSGSIHVCHSNNPLVPSEPVPPGRLLQITKFGCQNKVQPWSHWATASVYQYWGNTLRFVILIDVVSSFV